MHATILCDTGVEAGIRYTNGYTVEVDATGHITKVLPVSSTWTNYELRTEAIQIKTTPKVGDALAEIWTGEDTRLARIAGLMPHNDSVGEEHIRRYIYNALAIMRSALHPE